MGRAREVRSTEALALGWGDPLGFAQRGEGLEKPLRETTARAAIKLIAALAVSYVARADRCERHDRDLRVHAEVAREDARVRDVQAGDAVVAEVGPHDARARIAPHPRGAEEVRHAHRIRARRERTL